MKKLTLVLLSLFIILSFVIAQDDTLDPIEKAYKCLEGSIDNKSLSLQEAVFTTLALGSKSEVINKIDVGPCWPSSDCTVKDTAQVLLAYDRVNKNAKEIENWLLSNTGTSIGLNWFIQIDITSHIPSECTLTYKGSSNTVNINSDLTISGNPGSCLITSGSGYWLRVKDTCLSEKFQISCNEDFITNLLYQKPSSSTIFISPTTHSAASSGTTEEQIRSKCFKKAVSSSCDYEGSLWAAIALTKSGNDVSDFIPYLQAESQDNERLFPSSFIYSLTKGSDQLSDIVQSQKQNQFWQAPNTKYNKFYDTALGMLSLQGTSTPELSNAQSYLISVQTPSGCWNNNNIRDTAFLLYAGWPQTVTSVSTNDDDEIDDDTVIVIENCESAGFSCEARFECFNAGNILDEFFCPGFGVVCCDVAIVELGCTQSGGQLCKSSETCSGTVTSSIDGACCLGVCEEETEEISECERFDGSCEFSCDPSFEEETFDSCNDPSLVCCISKQTSTNQSSKLGVWITILSILIVIVIIGIIFRKRLQLMFHRAKGRRSSGFGPEGQGPGRPIIPPPRPPIIRRPEIRPAVRPRQYLPPQKSKTDKELDETLEKLRKMSE